MMPSLLNEMLGLSCAMAATLIQWLSDSYNSVSDHTTGHIWRWTSLHKAEGLMYALGALVALSAIMHTVYDFMLDLSGCEIQIRGDDPIAEYLKSWTRQHFKNRLLTNQTAETSVTSPPDSPPDNQAMCHQNVDTGYWRFDRAHEKLYTLYDVGYGSHFFLYRRRVWMYRRSKEESEPDYIDILSIRCIGPWSPANVQSLVREAKRYCLNSKPSMTQIFVPASKVLRQKGKEHWTCIQETRIPRDIATIDLEDGMKEAIISDLNLFLSPGQRQKYITKGIRYGRNILLHGPPGTGKSALIDSLAGVFGLGIYRISLSSLELTDDDLTILLSRLPSRCIVLFEDIDQAGLPMRRIPDVRRTTGTESSLQTFQPITLSGFLNAIDGVATPEGLVVFFTTNCLAKLDPAITRPGRVDEILELGLAGRSQIRSMFLRMYPSDPTSHADYESKAQTFANKVRDRSLTLARLQGFLLQYQGRPDDAIAAVEAWQGEEDARPAGDFPWIISAQNTHDDGIRQESGDAEKYVCSIKDT